MSEEETKPQHAYVRHTDEALETLAQNIIGGRVFHSLYHLPVREDPVQQFDDLQSTFMVFALAGKDFFDFIEEAKIVAAYAELSTAGSMAVNGHPVFFNAALLNVEDQDRLHARVLEIDAFMKSRKQGGNDGT